MYSPDTCNYHVIWFVVFCMICCSLGDSITEEESGNPCTYFDGARRSAPESSLVNCSWYATNACCKRTEVTSVFGEMYPLDGASKDCANQINYLMCYFCSPEQHRWYNKQAYVCEDYCRSVFEHCKTARYDGIPLGDKYQSGEQLCEGQRFKVVEGTSHCFKFDPTVFSHAYHTSYRILTIFILPLFILKVFH